MCKGIGLEQALYLRKVQVRRYEKLITEKKRWKMQKVAVKRWWHICIMWILPCVEIELFCWNSKWNQKTQKNTWLKFEPFAWYPPHYCRNNVPQCWMRKINIFMKKVKCCLDAMKSHLILDIGVGWISRGCSTQRTS